MRFAALLLVSVFSGCATAPARGEAPGEPIAPSKVKTVAVKLDDAVAAISGRAESLKLKQLSRANDAGAVVLVLEAPLERRAAVSSGQAGFTTDTFAFNRRYVMRFVPVDEGHTRIEVSTTAVFQDSETCSPTFALRDTWRMTPAWANACAMPTATGRPNVDVADSSERRWVASQEDPEEPLGALLGE
jgi:hypothetical protein